MKKRLQGLVAGILIGVTLVSGFASAKQISETAQLFYNNIKIFIDGAEIVPKDVVGNVVEPFIINGTTYLPVRAISAALGKDVEWDGKNASVYIGENGRTKPDAYLHKLQYNDYKEGDYTDDFSVIDGTITDCNGTIYNNGILFYQMFFGKIEDEPDTAQMLVGYPLNSQYKNLKGKIVLPQKYETSSGEKVDCLMKPVDVLFYGDGELIYKATNISALSPVNFDIDLNGINQLTIKVNADFDISHVALTDLALYK